MNNEGIYPKTSVESTMINVVENCSNIDDRDKACRDIISLAISKDFDYAYRNSLRIASIYDLAIRYLDKDTKNKEAIWDEIFQIASNKKTSLFMSCSGR